MSNMRTLLLSLATLVTTTAFGAPTMSAENVPKATSSTNFSLNLFQRVAAGSTKNVLVSPFSAYEALSMTANGAAGTTRSAMAKTLGFDGASFDSINTHNQTVLNSLNNNDKVQMEIANAIYADKRAPFKTSFIDLCAKFYSAEASSEDFADPATLKKINDWCDKKTHGKIKKIIDKLKPEEKMVLLNSVYFKGNWDSPFKKDDTKEEEFTLRSGNTKQVPMMHKSFSTGYFQGDGFQAISIPYAGKKQEMFVFLPAKGKDIDTLEQQFTVKNWQQWLSRFSATRVNCAMPKYKVEFSAELKAVLMKMGMAEAFGEQSDFSAMTTKPSSISAVLQKTYMDVNEEGTEAAAVTAVVMMTRAYRVQPPPVDFTVNRPFVVALVDKETDEILFLGSIIDP